MTISPWWLLLAAIPVLLLGELLSRRVALLRRFNIPVPVIGGLLVAFLILLANVTALPDVSLATRVSAKWWTWLITPEVAWRNAPDVIVYQPFTVAFFTTVGLNASWTMARRGGMPLIVFYVLSVIFTVLQTGLGVGLARALGESPYLGLLCSSVSLMGGHGTAMGFAPEFVKAGFAEAPVVGAAAATFGVSTASLVGGPIAAYLIRKHHLRAHAHADLPHSSIAPAGGTVLTDIAHYLRLGRTALVHLLVLLACIKVGSWVSYGLQSAGLTFPVYMGAMIAGIVVRNLLDALGKPVIRTGVVDLLGSIVLALFLAMAMASLNLIQLRDTAGPMLVILVAQLVLMGLFAYFVSFPVMGKSYDSAVMAGGLCGFAMGSTANAVATMETITERHGPAPQPFLIVTVIGAFLIDFANALIIVATMNLVR